MRMWGTGLYESEYASALKIEVLQLLSLPFDIDEILGILGEEHPEANDADDAMHPEFWLVIQDHFHTFGIQRTDIRDRASNIIRDGPDLSDWRDLDGGEANIRRRAKSLDKLAEKWATPRKRPRKRKVIVDGGPFLLEVGDVVAVNYGLRMAERYFQGGRRRDRWGAFIVLNRIRLHGVLPRYAVAQLNVDSEDTPPYLEACLASDIDNTLYPPHLAEMDPPETYIGEPLVLPSIVKRLSERGEAATPESARKSLRDGTGTGPGQQAYMRRKRLMVFFETISAERLERMQATVVGRLKLDEKSLGTDFPFIYSPSRHYVEEDHALFNFLRRRSTRNSEDQFVAGFRWPILQYVDNSNGPDTN
jgi:hypothetical protein